MTAGFSCVDLAIWDIHVLLKSAWYGVEIPKSSQQFLKSAYKIYQLFYLILLPRDSGVRKGVRWGSTPPPEPEKLL